MTIPEFEALHCVKLIRKDESWFMRLIGKVYPAWMIRFWTTYRLPFCKARITYPVGIDTPLAHDFTLQHELVHVRQFAPWYGPVWVWLLATLLPLPVFFSGRWFIERPAYLLDIHNGRRDPKSAADILWSSYIWPWPRSWMIKWFEERR